MRDWLPSVCKHGIGYIRPVSSNTEEEIRENKGKCRCQGNRVIPNKCSALWLWATEVISGTALCSQETEQSEITA